jgi:hypothetical protein
MENFLTLLIRNKLRRDSAQSKINSSPQLIEKRFHQKKEESTSLTAGFESLEPFPSIEETS